jgi:predicted Zn-dependent protease
MGPEEVAEFDPGEFTDYYGEIVDDLHDVAFAGVEAIGGVEYLRYDAAVEWDDPPGEMGDASLWLHEGDFLPRKATVSVELDGGSIEMVFDFLDYGKPVTLPERPSETRPWRDLELPDAPCIGDEFDACLQASADLHAGSSPSCAGTERRLCLAPLGNVSAEFVRHLVHHYQETYGLAVTVMTPSAIPAEAADPLRQQVDASALIRYLGELFPAEYADPSAVLIGITPLDLYNSDSHFRYVFGVKRTAIDPKAVVSLFRMDPSTYGDSPDDELLFSRARKLVTKYIGLLYYDLPPSDDPDSPMFDSILGPDDLDRMHEPLPVAGSGSSF